MIEGIFHHSIHVSYHAHQTGNNIMGSFHLCYDREGTSISGSSLLSIRAIFPSNQNEGRWKAMKVFVFRRYSPLSSRTGLLPKFIRRLSWQTTGSFRVYSENGWKSSTATSNWQL